MARQPRKPQQQRSKATIEAMVQAGFQVVAERGLATTTSQHLADRAGIGIGSFYEYFPNKEAIFAEMFTRMTSDIVQIIQDVTPELIQMELRDAIHLLLTRVGDMLRSKGGIYLRCAQHAVRSETLVDRAPIQRALTDLAMQYVMRHPQYLRGRDMPVSVYIFIHGGMHAFIHHLNDEAPPITYAQLVNGLANMIGHYAERELQIVESAGRASRRQPARRRRGRRIGRAGPGPRR